MARIHKVKQRCPLISVVVRCRKEIEQALFSHWSNESFSIDSEFIDGKMTAGVVHSIPKAPMINWNEQTQNFLNFYLQQTTDFVQQLMVRSQRPSVCIVVSSSVVYGSQVDQVEEGKPVENNVWADWIVQYENIFSSLDKVGIRVVYIRSGVVLVEGSIPSTYLYAGKKEDWVSWISSRDLCRFIDHCLRLDRAKGMYHLASSNWVQKKSCIRNKRIRAFSRIRTFIQGESIFSPSQKIVSRRIKDLEFHFSQENVVKIKN